MFGGGCGGLEGHGHSPGGTGGENLDFHLLAVHVDGFGSESPRGCGLNLLSPCLLTLPDHRVSSFGEPLGPGWTWRGSAQARDTPFVLLLPTSSPLTRQEILPIAQR